MIIINKEEFIKVCLESKSMSEASRQLNIPFTTFKRYAKILNVYKTNQGCIGIIKKKRVSKINLDDLNNDKLPNVQSYKLKTWLIKHHIKENKCECCGTNIWNNKPLNCQLHHIDGNKHNNKLSNLIMLCPNCHSQTETYTGKNIASNKLILNKKN